MTAFRLARGPDLAHALWLLLAFAAAGCAGGDNAAGDSSFAAAPDVAAGGPKLDPITGPPTAGDRFALLVGITEYPTPLADLPGPRQDVEQMRRLLIDRFGFPPDNIVTLIDRAATRDAVISGIRGQLGRASAGGVAVFYFAGHGVPMDGNYSRPDAETTGRDQALYVLRPDGRATVILDDELGYLLGGLTARRVVAIVDGCFSGTIVQVAERAPSGTPIFAASFVQARSPRPRSVVMTSTLRRDHPNVEVPTQFLTDGMPAPTRGGAIATDINERLLLTAATDDDEAFSLGDWPNRGDSTGVFTFYLRRALNSAGGNRSLRSVMERVRADVRQGQLCAQLGLCQQPQITGPDADQPIENILGRPR